MKKHKDLIFLLTAISLPYLLCILSGHTFAPTEALVGTVLPYRPGDTVSPPNNHFWSDTVTFYWPRLQVLARGELPISFSTGGGTPLYADSISGFFSPFSWIFFYLLPSRTYSIDLFWLAQTLVYCAGIYLWLARRGVSREGVAAATLTQGFCTAFFPGSYLAFQSLGAFTFLPWALWAEGLESKKLHWLLPPLFLSACFYSGNLQTALYPIVVYGLWKLITRSPLEGARTLALSVMFSLPFWYSSVEYHVFLGVQDISQRRSQVPIGFAAKVKAMLALPAVFVPELLGSSKHLDFIKAFGTSATYFIGSIGLLAPLVAAFRFRRRSWGNDLNKLSIALIAFCLVVMASSLLNIFYYRVIALLCLALSLLCATHLGGAPHRSRAVWAFPVIGTGLALLAGAAYIVKTAYREELISFFRERMASGSYAWWPELVEERIHSWFASYLSNAHFLLLPLLLLAAFFALRRQREVWLLILVALDAGLIWGEQVTVNQVRSFQNEAGYSRLNEILRMSPSYPASRFHALNCGHGPFLFAFSTQEYQGVPNISYYGSTGVRLLNGADYQCDERSMRVEVKEESLREGAINALITRAGWSLDPAFFRKEAEGNGFSLWAPRQIYPALFLPTHSENALTAVRSNGASGRGIEFSFELSKPIQELALSVPWYPGWHYELDGQTIRPTNPGQALPTFRADLQDGPHTLTAVYKPSPLYLCMLLAALSFIMATVWKNISRQE